MCGFYAASSSKSLKKNTHKHATRVCARQKLRAKTLHPVRRARSSHGFNAVLPRFYHGFNAVVRKTASRKYQGRHGFTAVLTLFYHGFNTVLTLFYHGFTTVLTRRAPLAKTVRARHTLHKERSCKDSLLPSSGKEL